MMVLIEMMADGKDFLHRVMRLCEASVVTTPL